MGKAEEFEILLKSAVGGKRLSQSKMESLTKLALSNMEYDTQMVSILYRTHKSLPTSGKVPSLYVFDSLARAARSQATKMRADPKSPQGNAATFLAKIEGVLDGLIGDMIATGIPEAKEKTLKILDIWSKANTFPPSVITHLIGLTQAGGGTAVPASGIGNTNQPSASNATPESVPAPVVDPRRSLATSTPRSQSNSVPPTPTNDASALLALLAQAQGAPTLNTPMPATPSATPTAPSNGLGTSHYNLLQHLAGYMGNPTPACIPVDPLVNSNVPPAGSLAASSTYPGASSSNESYDHRDGSSNHSRDPRHDRPRGRYDDHSSPRRDSRDYHRDDRYDDRGGRRHYEDRRNGHDDRKSHYDRGGRDYARDYGKGSSHRRDWEDRGNGRRRSRSRSPVRRDRGRPYGSPSRRDTTSSTSVEGGEPAGAVDEFGREIRPGDSDTPSSQPTEDGVKPGGVEGAAAAKTGAEQAPSNGPEVAPAAPGATGPEQVESAPASDPKEGSTAGGLESLDFSSLNFSDPVAWTTLGKAWEVSYGRLPMQEEMMMFMAQGMNMDPMALMGATMTQNNANGSTSSWNAGDSSWNNAGGQTWNGHQGFQGRGRGRGRGRGGRGYGGYNAGAGGGQQAYPDSSDAVILGGDTTDTSASNAQQASYADGNYGDGSNYGEGYANGYGGGGNDGMYAAYGNGYYDGSGSGNGDAMGGAMYSAGATQDATAPTGEETQVDGEGSAPAEGRSKGGHMVRVGDGWQWVKAGDGSATS